MPARSQTLLNSRLGEIGCLLDICKTRKNRRSKRIQIEEPALLRGALVLLSSHIEGFFEELVCDVIEAVDYGSRTPNTMPQEIRAHQIIGDPARWSTSDQNKRWALIQKAASSPLIDDNAIHVAGHLDPGLHIDKFSNPGTGEIQNLFRTVGILDCWDSFKKIEPRMTYKNEIDAIVSRRNQIAHGDMNATITHLDIDSYINNFNHTSSVFCLVCEDHIAKYVHNFRWP